MLLFIQSRWQYNYFAALWGTLNTTAVTELCNLTVQNYNKYDISEHIWLVKTENETIQLQLSCAVTEMDDFHHRQKCAYGSGCCSRIKLKEEFRYTCRKYMSIFFYNL